MDIWVVVLCAAAGCQAFKLLLYSAVQHRLNLAILGQSAGLPSLHAVVGSSLFTLMITQTGWMSAETSLALVFAAITVFDAIRVRGAAEAQRRLVHDLVLRTPQASILQRRVATYLDMVAHAPDHVAAGLIWGTLFAVAFGALPR